MLNRQRLLDKLFTSFITVSISIIAAETALSNPVLIDPSKEYQETDYIVNGGNAYDFCYDNKSLGYIVVSEAASKRLERRYPIRSNCTIPTTSTTGSNAFSQYNSSSFPSSSNNSPDFYSNNASSGRYVSPCKYSDRDSAGKKCKCPYGICPTK